MDKASVWQYFNRANGGQAGECKKCGRKIKSVGGSTSGLHAHLKSQHKINSQKREHTDETPTSTKTKSKITDYIKSVDETLPAVISRMVAKDGICFNTFCTSYDVRKLLVGMGYKDIPKSPNTIRKIVLDYGTKIRNLVIDDFSAMKGRVFSVTMDEWTSIRNRRYMNVNLHAENKFWNLGLIRINGSMSAEKAIEYLEEKLARFTIKMDDIISMTTDGASVMKKAGKLSGLMHQLCLAHGLQLAVNKVLYKKTISTSSRAEEEIIDISNDEEDEDNSPGLEVIPESTTPSDIRNNKLSLLICKVRSIVNLYKRSSLKNDNLQKHIKDEFGKELTLHRDCETRWNSLLKMLERFYEIKNPILKSLIDIKSGINIDNIEFDKISDIILALQPVKVAVEALCREDINLYTADITLKFLLNELSKHSSFLARELKEELIIRIKERRTIYFDVINYLDDPDAINDFGEYGIFNITNKTTIMAKIIDITKPVFSRDENYTISEQKDREEDEIEIVKILTLEEKLKLAMEAKTIKINDENKADKPKQDINSVIQKEMSYFELEKSRGKYLNIAFQHLMTCRPTSVESERAFSSAGKICTKFRSGLKDESIDMICFMRAYFNAQKSTYQIQ